METVTDAVGKLWFLGAGIVAIAAYAYTIKVRIHYVEKKYYRQITAVWGQVNKLIKDVRNNGN